MFKLFNHNYYEYRLEFEISFTPELYNIYSYVSKFGNLVIRLIILIIFLINY